MIKILRHTALSLPVAFVLAACIASSNEIGPEGNTSEYRALEVAAVSNLQCAWENQERCAHMIENRTLFPRFFTPEGLGGLDEGKKRNGRRVATKFLVEATASISQCRPVAERSIVLLKGVKISKGLYQVNGTAPLSETSSCFLTPVPENS